MTLRPSPQMQVMLERLAIEDAGIGDPTLLPPAEGRAVAAQTNRRWNRELPPMARIETFDVRAREGHAIACRMLVPPNDDGALIVYVHGGGWAFCNMETHERAARLLAQEAGAAVLTFDYRLAPEHPYPAGLNNCVDVWRHVAGHNGPTAISGDSAGANLALALMLHEMEGNRPQPDAGLFFYGVYAAEFESQSYRECEFGPGLTRAKMMRYWDWYAASAALRDDPLVAPLCASDAALRALPPLYLNAAEIDPLRSDTERLHGRLKRLGRPDVFRLHDGVVHGFMQMSLDLAEAHAATVEAAHAFRAIVGANENRKQKSGG